MKSEQEGVPKKRSRDRGRETREFRQNTTQHRRDKTFRSERPNHEWVNNTNAKSHTTAECQTVSNALVVMTAHHSSLSNTLARLFRKQTICSLIGRYFHANGASSSHLHSFFTQASPTSPTLGERQRFLVKKISSLRKNYIQTEGSWSCTDEMR